MLLALLALLVGAALALPPAVLGPDGPLWIGPMPPVSGQDGGGEARVVVAPLTGELWVEEQLPGGALRAWTGSRWTLNGAPLTEEAKAPGHRFEDGRLVAAPGAHGATQAYAYDEAGRLRSIRWPNGATLRVQYGEDGRVVSTSGPGPAIWRFTWGEALVVRDPLGRSLSIRVEDADDARVLTVKDALGRTIRSRYALDPAGDWRLTGWQDPRGLNTRIRRRPQHLEVQDPAGRIWRVKTDAAGRVVRVTMPAGQRWVWQRDEAGRVRRIDDPAGRITRWERDEQGLVVAITRGGHQTRYRRDEAGRVIAVVSSSGGTTELVRDEQGQVSSIRDAAGNPVFFERHDNGWPSLILGRTGGRWTVGLDLLGQPARFENPAGVVQKVVRDAAGRIQRLEHPVYGVVTLQHGQDGRLTKVEGGDKRTAKLSWDGAGRLTQIEVPGQSVVLQWDPAGDVVGVRLGEQKVKIQRDPTGLPVGAGDIRWRRDLNGRVIAIEQPGRVLRLERDPAGWLRGLKTGDWTLDIHRDGVGWPVGWTGTDGTLELVRDGAGRVTREVGERTLRLLRGGRGEVSKLVSDVGEWRWLRDAAGRVLRVHGGEKANLGFDRDEAGRVILVRLPSGALMRRKHLPDGVTEVVADAGGAMIDARTTRWDADGRLRSVTNETGAGWHWAWGEDGRLASIGLGDGVGGWTFGDGQITGPAGEFMLKDAAGRVTEVHLPESISIWGQQTAQLGIHFSDTGQMEYLTGAEGQTRLLHDALGRLQEVRLPDGRAWTLRYDVRGRPAEVLDPEGVTHRLIWHPGVEQPTGQELLAVTSIGYTERHIRGPGGSGVVIGKTAAEILMTAEGEPAWRFSGRSTPEPLSATPQGLGAGPQLRWIGPGGKLQLFPGGPLLQADFAIDPVTGARTDGARPWPWAAQPVRADGTEGRIDPADWSPRSPWSTPLRLLTAMGEIQPIDEGHWWAPSAGPVAVSWLPASLDGAEPPLGHSPHAMPLAPLDSITAGWLMQVLSVRGQPDLGLPIRAVLQQELRLPWLPPGLQLPGLKSWGVGTQTSNP
jgi:YD repeat-containing protein